MTDELPDYVDYGSLMTPPGPFRSLNTTLYGFWVRADRGKLDELCRRVFAEPSGGVVHFRPLGSRVMLTWGHIERVISETPPFDRMGNVAEPQVVLWVPTALVKPRAGLSVARQFAVFAPYIWVDNAMSLATGREVYGYPKGWGWLSFPRAGSPPSWKLDVFGLNYGRDEGAARHPLLTIAEGDSFGGGSPPGVGPPRNLGKRHRNGRMGGASRLVWGGEVGRSFAHILLHRQFPGVFLKQFRAVEDGRKAALQQVVETTYRVTRLAATPLLHEYSLTVHDLDSHPVRQELGLESQTTRLAYRAEMDFLVGAGRVLWDAADPPEERPDEATAADADERGDVKRRRAPWRRQVV